MLVHRFPQNTFASVWLPATLMTVLQMRLAACCSATCRIQIELGDVAECSTRLALMSCNCASGLVGFVPQTRDLPEEIPLQVGADWIACPFCLGATC